MSDAVWAATMPEVYDRCLGPVLFAPYAELLAARAASFAPRAVLEVGAGSGRVTSELVRALPQAAITATDLNPAMVEFGAARVPAAHWQPADAQALPFPPASFDLVVSSFTVMFLPDRAAAYRDIARLLTPEGRFLFTTWDAVEPNELTAAYLRAVATVLPENTPDFVRRIPHGYHDADRIRAELAEAGYSDVAVERVALPSRAIASAAAEGFCYGTPMRFALEERGDLAELTAAIAAALSASLGTGEIAHQMSAFVGTCTTFS